MVDERAAGEAGRPNGDEIPAWGHEGAPAVHRSGFRAAGAVLRTARAHAGLSQRELAERAGVALSSIVRTEAARSVPGWNLITACLDACEMTLALVARDGQLVLTAPLVLERDAAGRHYPAHLPVWAVLRHEQWWDSHPLRRVPVPLDELPPYSFRRRNFREEGRVRWERD